MNPFDNLTAQENEALLKFPAYIFEFKKHHQIKEQNIDETLQNAMSQIKTRNYAATLQQEGFQNIELIAIAFKGKEVKLCWEKVV